MVNIKANFSKLIFNSILPANFSNPGIYLKVLVIVNLDIAVNGIYIYI